MYKKLRSVSTVLLGIIVAGVFQSANADWNLNARGISAADPQDVVVSLKTNPRRNLEQACLAVTFARSLAGNPNSNITLFVTLDGVALAKERVIKKRRLKCVTPWGEVSLKEHLETFINGDNNAMVICPICWKERYGDKLPDYGVLPGAEGVPGTAIGKMIFNADKILGF